MITAFGVDSRAIDKKYWESDAPKETKSINLVPLSAGAAGIGAGAGIMYLATRGKGTKVITRAGKATAKTPKPKTPNPDAPIAPSPTGMRAAAGPIHDVPPEPLRVAPAQIDRQRKMNLRRIDDAQAKVKAPEVKTHDPRVKTEVEYPENLTQKEVDAAADAKYGTEEQINNQIDVGPSARRRARRANAQMHGKQGKSPRKNPINKSLIRKSADPSERVSKAITGEKGDLRNTQYAAAGGLGYIVGVNAGSRLGARYVGTTHKKNRQKFIADMDKYSAKQKKLFTEQRKNPKMKHVNIAQMAANLGQSKKNQKSIYKPGKEVPDPKTWKPSIKEMRSVESKVKGTRAMHVGGVTGAIAGTGLGVLAVGAARRKKTVEL